MPLYGRSFKMAQAGCTGPSCLFLGGRLDSQAAKGLCTNTAGYISNVELRLIKDSNSNGNTDLYGERMVKEFESLSGDILVYDDTEWVSWIKRKTYIWRSVQYINGNFGGTSDWAIDLENDFQDGGTGDEYDDSELGNGEFLCDFGRTFDDLFDLQRNADGMELFCRQVHSLQVLDKMLDDLYAEYKRVDNGYDSKFDAYVRYINRITPYAIDNFMAKGGRDCKSFTRSVAIDLLSPSLETIVHMQFADTRGGRL
jgi:hypothetical protein